MATELTYETLISLVDAARLLPPARQGRPVSMSCILRWILSGVRTPSGVVRLEAVRLGGRWLTSREALQRFAEQQTPNLTEQAPPAPRPPAARRCAAQRAERELRRIGI
jgi:hypothetical protein